MNLIQLPSLVPGQRIILRRKKAVEEGHAGGGAQMRYLGSSLVQRNGKEVVQYNFLAESKTTLNGMVIDAGKKLGAQSPGFADLCIAEIIGRAPVAPKNVDEVRRYQTDNLAASGARIVEGMRKIGLVRDNAPRSQPLTDAMLRGPSLVNEGQSSETASRAQLEEDEALDGDIRLMRAGVVNEAQENLDAGVTRIGIGERQSVARGG